MLEFIRKYQQTWIAKIVLALITIPFALWGVDSYLNQAGTSIVIAKVNDEQITMQQFQKALQEVRNNIRGEVAPDFMEDPEIRQAVLDNLINSRLLSLEIKRRGYTVSNDALTKAIVSMPVFQNDGRFSQDLYDQVLTANRMTPSNFESSMRGDLLLQQVRDGISTIVFSPDGIADYSMKIQNQLREISTAIIHSEDYLPKVKISEQEVKAYYDEHENDFRVPDQVKIEYVILSAANLIASQQVTDEEAREFYKANSEKFGSDEERRSSHILIAFGTDKDAARKKAQKVLAEVKQSPDKFDQLAKKYSDDPGSAENGGDLGFVKRGVMVPAFEDALFSMSPGSISNLVETNFGFHIIKLSGVNGSTVMFDEVKPKIRAELMYQQALTNFADVAESFSNTVYEQSTSLEPAAQAQNLQVQKSGWLSQADVAKFFKDNQRLASAVFSDEVRKERRNTEAIEIEPNTIVSARVIDERPSSIKSFEMVKDSIETDMKNVQASKLAAEHGKQLLNNFKNNGEQVDVAWSTPVFAGRKNAQGLSDSVLRQAFRMNVSKLPAYVGSAAINGDYVLVRVSAVKDGMQEADDEGRKAAKMEYVMALTDEYQSAFIKSLRDAAEITVNKNLLIVKDTP